MSEARTVDMSRFTRSIAGLNTAYILWGACMSAAGAVGLILVLNVVIFLVNGLSEFFGLHVIVTGVDHDRWLLISMVIASIAGTAHLIRRRSDALAREIISVRFPGEIHARVDCVDIKRGDIHCRAQIEVGVHGAGLEATLRGDWKKFGGFLEVGLNAALNDPVARYSKAKIEEILTQSLAPHFDPRDLAGVRVINLSQTRMRKKPPLAASENNESRPAQGLPEVPNEEARQN